LFCSPWQEEEAPLKDVDAIVDAVEDESLGHRPIGYWWTCFTRFQGSRRRKDRPRLGCHLGNPKVVG